MKRAVYVSAKAYMSNAEIATLFESLNNNAENELDSKVDRDVNPIYFNIAIGLILLVPWVFIVGVLAVFGLDFSWKMGGIIYGVLVVICMLLFYFGKKNDKKIADKKIAENKSEKSYSFQDESPEMKEVELFLTTVGVEIGEDTYTWDELDIVVELEDWLIFDATDGRMSFLKIKNLKERKLDRIYIILEKKGLLYEIS